MRSLVKDVVTRWRGAPGATVRPDRASLAGDLRVERPGLRSRRADDLGACVRLLAVVHNEDGYPVYWPDSPRSWLGGSDVLDALVVERRRELLGHVAIVSVGHDARSALHWRELTGRQSRDLGGVSRLFVRRRARGEGIGGALLDAAEASIRHRGLLPVLDVVSTSAGAVRLYDERGWRLLATYPWGRRDDDLHIHYYRGPA